ncbi:MAG: RNA polymerase subunit sigma-70 [Alphaproteobacteria bacterium]|nr:RNA polymerase subunit sigma-70 [Alphaproteobacteria bacterium]
MSAARLAERVARESYGRLIAQLAARTRDVTAAEDALSEAFAAALKTWPHTGAPENPEAWLFTAAKRKLIDAARRAATVRAGEAALIRAAEEIEAEMAAREPGDRRLGLLFACAHPAIDPGARTPLMLQAVLGLSGARIAAAFMVAPAAMSQRLVRAKKKIAEAEIPFDVPPAEEWAPRLGAVLEAVYAAYAEGWTDARGEDAERRALAEEALWLARIASQQARTPEAAALVALILMLEARRPARRDAAGGYVPLDAQDVRLWRKECVEEAIQIMAGLAPYTEEAGRFQIEAAIQHAHMARYFALPVNWGVIESLYVQLGAIVDSPAVRLNAAAARARHAPPGEALSALDALVADAAALRSYQPYWALRADLLARLGRREAARAAYDEAIARERDGAVRRFLLGRREAL